MMVEVGVEWRSIATVVEEASDKDDG